MIHQRKDYNRIQDPAGIIPADEPVMLFRAQDKFAAKVLDYYASLLEKETQARDEAWTDDQTANELAVVSAGVREQSRKFRHWRHRKNPNIDEPQATQEEEPK